MTAHEPRTDWVVVPREPTPRMMTIAAATEGMKAVDSLIVVAAIHGSSLPTDLKETPLVQAYKAALAAAPDSGHVAVPQGLLEQSASCIEQAIDRMRQVTEYQFGEAVTLPQCAAAIAHCKKELVELRALLAGAHKQRE